MLFGPSFTSTSDVALFPTGQEIIFTHPSYGVITCVYGQNGSGGALAQGDLLRQKSNEVTPIFDVCATASFGKIGLRGVADHAVPQNYYFWSIVKGRCQIKGDGSVTAGTSIVSDATAAGRAKNEPAPANAAEAQANAQAVFGVATANDGAAGSLFAAIIDLL